MGFIVKKIGTNNVYYSKGANKIAYLIGCHYSTITKHFQKSKDDKEIKGYLVSITIDLNNNDRGSSPKSCFKDKNDY